MNNHFQPNHTFETELVEAINPRRAGMVLLNGCLSPLWVQEVAAYIEGIGEDLAKLHKSVLVLNDGIGALGNLSRVIVGPNEELALETVKVDMLVCSFPLVLPADLRGAVEFVKRGGTVLAAVHGISVADTMTRLRASLGISRSSSTGLEVPVQMIDCGIHFRPWKEATA